MLIEAVRFCNDYSMKLIGFETEEKWLAVSKYMIDNGKIDSTLHI
jgi:hypothetical protein